MENADRKVSFACDPMPASSTCRPPPRRLKNTQNRQGFAFVYLFLVSWTAVSGSLEGRFQLTSQPGLFAPATLDELPSLSLSSRVFAASNGNILGDLNVGQPYRVPISSKSTENSELSVLNLTLTTIRFFQHFVEDNVIMDRSSGDSENPYTTRSVSKWSELVSVEKKHKGLRDYLKARVSSKPNIVSVDENLERRVAPTNVSKRLAFLKGLRGLTKRTRETTTPVNFASVKQNYETHEEKETSTTIGITDDILGSKPSGLDGESSSVNSGKKSVKDMMGMIRKLKKSTAFPQSDGTDAVQSRTGNEPESKTTKPKDDLSTAIRNFLKEGVRSSKVNLRVGSLANDSIGLLPDNKTSTIDILSIRSNSFVSNDSKASTFVSTQNPSSENTTTSTTTKTVTSAPIEEIFVATSKPIALNKTTSFPTSKVQDKTIPSNNSLVETTKHLFTATVASTPGHVLMHHKRTTSRRSETISPIIKTTGNLPGTEFQQLSSSLPPKKLVSAAEESEIQKFTSKYTETSIDFQTSLQLLKRSSTKLTTDLQLITDDQGWDRNSTSTPQTPHAGPVVERDPLTIYADTAGLTVCLVILCVGLLLFVIGIYFVCQSSKPRDSDDNVHPYSARRFSDA